MERLKQRNAALFAGNDSSSSTPTNTTPDQPIYLQQFSAATSLILDRMGKGTWKLSEALSGLSESELPSDKAAFVAAKTRLMENMSTSQNITGDGPLGLLQLPPDTPSTLASSSEVIEAQQRTLKRKRQDAEPIDFTQTTIAFPNPLPQTERYPPVSQTLSTATPIDIIKNEVSLEEPSPNPSATAPALLESPMSELRNSRNATVRRCNICHQSMSASEDRIVTCRRCNTSSHHHCVPSAKLTIKSGETLSDYLCDSCFRIEKKLGKLSSLGPLPRDNHDVDQLRKQRLAALPEDVQLPPKTKSVGFGGGNATDYQRTEYFYSKTKTELLNILSFCDQLQPQLLVDVLVSISKKHPELPIFDSPDWIAGIPSELSKPLSPSLLSSSYRRHRHGHTLQPKSRSRHKSLKKYFNPTSAAPSKSHRGSGMGEDGNDDDEDGQEEIDEEGEEETGEEPVPPTWPKAGEGLYAKLVPEVEDREFLVDAGDEEAFSQFLVDKLGKQVTEGEVVVA